jgi:hypothetical protein
MCTENEHNSIEWRQTSASRLADLRMVPLAERGHRLLMIVQPRNAFFDESGTHDGSEIISVGGLIATYDGWSRWELEWQRILASRGIEVFHFSEFMARKGEFENDWSDSERNDFMERLCTTVSQNIRVGLVTSVFKDNYEQVVPEDLREQLKHPYYFGLYTCVWQLVTLRRMKGMRVELPNPIESLFDRKEGFEGVASDIFYAIRKQFKDLGWDTGLGDMGFGAKDKDIPLQAADLLVGVVARNRLRLRHKGLPLEEETMEKSLLALGKSGSLLISEARPEELEAFVNVFRPNFYPKTMALMQKMS